jgi:hypothetical protein
MAPDIFPSAMCVGKKKMRFSIVCACVENEQYFSPCMWTSGPRCHDPIDTRFFHSLPLAARKKKNELSNYNEVRFIIDFLVLVLEEIRYHPGDREKIMFK